MATATRGTAFEEPWLQLPARWSTFLRLARDRGEKGPRLTYHDGTLTVVSPGFRHQVLKTTLGGLLGDVFVGLQTSYWATGGTWLVSNGRPWSATEPDLSYSFTKPELPRGQEAIVIGRDPPPDLVVEVAATHPLGDSLEVYRRFGVREVWVCDEDGLTFHLLGEDGAYAPSPASGRLPF